MAYLSCGIHHNTMRNRIRHVPLSNLPASSSTRFERTAICTLSDSGAFSVCPVSLAQASSEVHHSVPCLVSASFINRCQTCR
eukprot:42625-Amphidinium_carterae.2